MPRGFAAATSRPSDRTPGRAEPPELPRPGGLHGVPAVGERVEHVGAEPRLGDQAARRVGARVERAGHVRRVPGGRVDRGLQAGAADAGAAAGTARSTGPAGRRRACRTRPPSRRRRAAARGSAWCAGACRGPGCWAARARARTSARASAARTRGRGRPGSTAASRPTASRRRGCPSGRRRRRGRCRRGSARSARRSARRRRARTLRASRPQGSRRRAGTRPSGEPGSSPSAAVGADEPRALGRVRGGEQGRRAGRRRTSPYQASRSANASLATSTTVCTSSTVSLRAHEVARRRAPRASRAAAGAPVPGPRRAVLCTVRPANRSDVVGSSVARQPARSSPRSSPVCASARRVVHGDAATGTRRRPRRRSPRRTRAAPPRSAPRASRCPPGGARTCRPARGCVNRAPAARDLAVREVDRGRRGPVLGEQLARRSRSSATRPGPAGSRRARSRWPARGRRRAGACRTARAGRARRRTRRAPPRPGARCRGRGRGRGHGRRRWSRRPARCPARRRRTCARRRRGGR